jgi:hypothetical protein
LPPCEALLEAAGFRCGWERTVALWMASFGWYRKGTVHGWFLLFMSDFMRENTVPDEK